MDTRESVPAAKRHLRLNAPDGLCPECLLKAALGTGVDLGPDSQAESGQSYGTVAPGKGAGSASVEMLEAKRRFKVFVGEVPARSSFEMVRSFMGFGGCRTKTSRSTTFAKQPVKEAIWPQMLLPLTQV